MYDINKQYNQFSKTYSESFENFNNKSISDYFRYLDFNVLNKKILDIGCGDGKDSILITKRGAKFFGIDTSEEMIELSKINNPDATFIKGSFQKIPYSSKSFDIVITKWAMQILENIDEGYKEINRVLKKKGIFIFLVSHPIRQLMEKKKKDYFYKEIVLTRLFNNSIIIKEPHHTLKDYFSEYFLKNFEIISYNEGWDEGAERINNWKYPAYLIIKSRKK